MPYDHARHSAQRLHRAQLEEAGNLERAALAKAQEEITLLRELVRDGTRLMPLGTGVRTAWFARAVDALYPTVTA